MKTAVTAFGRLNPVTIGHELLINKIISTAKKEGADYFLFVSQTTDPKKNPLPYKKKVEFIRKMFPDSNVVYDEKVKTAFDVIKNLGERGYKKVIFIAGSDRVPEYEKFGKYAEKDYQMEFVVMSAGDRDPDSDGASGMSASKMRKFAADNDKVNFMKGLKKTASEKLKNEIWAEVRKGMGLE